MPIGVKLRKDGIVKKFVYVIEGRVESMTPVKEDMTPVKEDMTPVKEDMTPVKGVTTILFTRGLATSVRV